MIIYRDGQAILLTYEEMQVAYNEMAHLYALGNAAEQFLAKINYEENMDDACWLRNFQAKYGFLPEQATNPDSSHYAMAELLALFEERQSDYQSEDSVWDTAVRVFLRQKQSIHDARKETVPVKINFYAKMEDGFEYSELRNFEDYPSAGELENLLREFKQQAEYMNDSIAVSFRTEYAGIAKASEGGTKGAPAIPDEMAAQFGTSEGRRKLMASYGNSNTSYCGTNQDGETVELEISSESIKYVCYQNNGWVRVNWYDQNGNATGETFDGKWK